MKIYETIEEIEYYLILPNKAHGETTMGEKIHFGDSNEITTYVTKEEWLEALEENEIEYIEQDNIEE